MFYTDIHSHMLFGTDDGPARAEEMCAMVDEAYRTGTRRICLTPHMAPALFHENSAEAQAAFAILSDYVSKKYPDLSLSLGNELGYHSDWQKNLKEGKCRLLGGKYLLVDFLAGVTLFELRYALDDLLSSGVHPILAHAERYEALRGEYDLLQSFCRRGLLLQINASAFTDQHSFREKRHIKKLIAKCHIAAVASDAHNTNTRPPSLAGAEKVIVSRYGADAAALWLSLLPNRILDGMPL